MSYISVEKLKELTEQLLSFQSKGRKEIAERLDEAKSFGDLSENAEYHNAREDQGKMEARIAELEDIVKNAQILKKHHCEVVEMGATVVICKKDSSKKQTFEITGNQDADIADGKLDEDSPLAKAMMKKKAGDSFELKKPNGEKVFYKIISIK
jgi:transcription elongation factor GreA